MEPTASGRGPAEADSIKISLDGPKETGAQRALRIVDAQNVKNSDTACQKGHDAAKKVLGIKRHLAVNKQGFAHTISVTTAEVSNHKGGLFALKNRHLDSGRGTVWCVIAEMSVLRLQNVGDILGQQVQVELATRRGQAPLRSC